MPDLKLLPLLEATQVERIGGELEPFVVPGADVPDADSLVVETTRLQPPHCYWATYRLGRSWFTLKSFFSEQAYTEYVALLEEHYGERIGKPRHPDGGILPLPDINAVLWGFPFDPLIPGLRRCLDRAWIAAALRVPGATVDVEVLDYNPEISTLLAYRDPAGGATLAYGKSTSEQTCGLIYLFMERLWERLGGRAGGVELARPLAFRAEADLLLQSPVKGKTVGPARNRRAFLQLAQAAGRALAAVHGSDICFGPERVLMRQIASLRDDLPDLALAAPNLYPTVRQLVEQLEARAGRSSASPLVTSHGDYKWDQFLVHRGRFALIDFERFCRAEPALDLGEFCAYLPPSVPLDWRDSAAAEALRGEFLRAYQEAGGAEIDIERLGLFEARTLASRGLHYVWSQQQNGESRAAQMVDLAFERLVNPEPPDSGELLLL